MKLKVTKQFSKFEAYFHLFQAVVLLTFISRIRRLSQKLMLATPKDTLQIVQPSLKQYIKHVSSGKDWHTT